MVGKKLTYISLFSAAGVGCYGFKQADFQCIATNELLSKRLKIQTFNNKCKYNAGYILGDIKDELVKKQIYEQINFWTGIGNDKVDVVIATPPCQGMSVANQKKNNQEIDRNSLIVESVKMVKQIQPRFFIFENVPAFWKTECYYNNSIVSIGEMITSELSKDYIFEHQILNFKNYGSNSSRTRTLVIGVHKSESDHILPFELFPDFQSEKTLFQVIGDMPKLNWNEFDPKDFYHNFRVYSEHMRKWISNTKQGQSAFDNLSDQQKPHKIVDGKILVYQAKNGDKYKRQLFDKVAPCIHTRNDQLASQNTIHPIEDRVFSIRELMKMMTIPEEFRWVDFENKDLSEMDEIDKRKIYKKEEINIRQSIGEAVPTNIFYQIALKIKKAILCKKQDIDKIIAAKNLTNFDNLEQFVLKKKDELCFSNLVKIIEKANVNKKKYSAFYTPKTILSYIFAKLPEFDKKEISILEPAVGSGNFLPFLFKKYHNIPKVNLTIIELDESIFKLLKILFNKENIPKNFEITFINADYLTTKFSTEFDLIIGNPPFSKLSTQQVNKYNENFIYSAGLKNTAGLFLEKSLTESKNISFILPKNILNSSEYEKLREKLNFSNIYSIIDFGEIGFDSIGIETININISSKQVKQIIIKSIPQKIEITQNKKYIFDNKLPHWVIYRNSFFDKIFEKMKFNVFSVFRDRQITKKMTTNSYKTNYIPIIKSRNIDVNGEQIIKIHNYDEFIDLELAKKTTVFKFLNNDDVYLVPNMTYKPRIIKKPKGYITNGSIAILSNNDICKLNKKQMLYIASEEFRKFYFLARNFQTRSLNIDSTSVFWFGINKELE